MTLFLSKLANDGAALVDVFTITRCDSALGVTAATSQVDRITYAKTSSGAGQDRIEALVQSAGNVVISAVPNGTNIPDGAGNMIPINLVGGATYPADANGLIQVAYCFDNPMFGFDTAGNQISLPRSVIVATITPAISLTVTRPCSLSQSSSVRTWSRVDTMPKSFTTSAIRLSFAR